MTMPKQKPGRSKQDYCTPDELLEAVKKRLTIQAFSWDLAASSENTVAANFYTDAEDALQQSWPRWLWSWCNPPFEKIEPWVKKAKEEAENGAQTVMLVPASVGSNWYATWVEPYAFVSFLNPRLTFKGESTPYPKDCMLLFYTPWGFKGSEVWHWHDNID